VHLASRIARTLPLERLVYRDAGRANWIPRCCAYHFANASGSATFRNTPLIPVARELAALFNRVHAPTRERALKCRRPLRNDRLSNGALADGEPIVMTFWDFFDALVAHVKHRIELPGKWPFGVFGRDPTEALIQFGKSSVIFSAHGSESEIVVRTPDNEDRTYRVEMSLENAERLGDEIGRLLASSS